jgi:hypothetical protein
VRVVCALKLAAASTIHGAGPRAELRDTPRAAAARSRNIIVAVGTLSSVEPPMTLVLTLTSRNFVLQVSDRLVSEQRGCLVTPRWPARNKTIVYLARDAFVSLSYSGFAMLDGLSTDDWMARLITGVSDWNGDVPPAIRKRPVPCCRDLGTLLALLQRNLGDAVARLPPTFRDLPHTVTLSGWQWKRRGGRARPLLWLIYKRLGATTFEVRNCLPRHWYGSDFRLSAVPFDALSDDEAHGLQDQLQHVLSSHLDAERFLVEAIRGVGKSHRGIGRHCMSVYIRPPEAHVRFVAAAGETEARPFPGLLGDPRLGTTLAVGPAPIDDTSAIAPSSSSYWPWIILRDRLLTSHVLAMGTAEPFTFGLRDFTVSASAVEL